MAANNKTLTLAGPRLRGAIAITCGAAFLVSLCSNVLIRGANYTALWL